MWACTGVTVSGYTGIVLDVVLQVRAIHILTEEILVLFNKFIWLLTVTVIKVCYMADLITDILIYAGIGIITFAIGMILGYQLLVMYYTKRFMVVAKECSDADSVIPMVDELARES